MFQKNDMPIREGAHEAETVIAASVKVEGDFNSQGNVLIEGTVEGKLTTAKDLRVGERAKISADVTAMNAVVAGEIRGNITAAERLELEPTARIIGDVHTKILTVAAGATISGRVMMGSEVAESAAKSGKRAIASPVVPAPAAEEEEVVVSAAKPGFFG